ncbi:hypothetical protein HKD37_07G019574 [Glycine soja]
MPSKPLNESSGGSLLMKLLEKTTWSCLGRNAAQPSLTVGSSRNLLRKNPISSSFFLPNPFLKFQVLSPSPTNHHFSPLKTHTERNPSTEAEFPTWLAVSVENENPNMIFRFLSRMTVAGCSE